MVSAVIFDFDGVVLDSETPEFESHRRIYERHGVTLSVDEWCGQIGIYTEGYERRWFAELCGRCATALTEQEYDAEKRRIFDSLLPRGPMRGVADLLHELQRAGVPAAIASTSPARWVVPAAERIGVAPFFRTIVSGDEVRNRKPAPDVYLEAARRLNADPRRAVAIEDSAPGIASARAAGMRTVAVPHRLTERHDLGDADLRVAHIGELTLHRLEQLVAV
jgi:HAD superfamily hydrolase (TIGR01509 family)